MPAIRSLKKVRMKKEQRDENLFRDQDGAILITLQFQFGNNQNKNKNNQKANFWLQTKNENKKPNPLLDFNCCD